MAARKRPAKRKPAAVKKTPAKRQNPLAREIAFLVVLLFGALSLLSIFHLCGVFGEWLSSLLFGLLGMPAYVFPVYLVVAGGFYISNADNSTVRKKVWMSTGLFWSVCGLFQWASTPHSIRNVWEIYNYSSEGRAGGGFLGGILSFELARLIGRAGALIVILAFFLLFFMLVSGMLIFSSLQKLYHNIDLEKEEDGVCGEEAYGYEEPVVMPPQRRRGRDRAPLRPIKLEKDPKKEKTEPVQEDLPEIQIFRGAELSADGGLEYDSGAEIYEKELADKFGSAGAASTKNDVPGIKEEFHDAVPAGSGVQENGATESVAPESGVPESGTAGTSNPETQKPAKTGKKASDSSLKEPEGLDMQQELEQAAVQKKPYIFPPLELLNLPKKGKKGMNNTELRATAQKLQNTLQSFGVRVKMGDISLGPSVTRYELVPEQGVKVSKITSLTDDIKLSLAASDIRIEAPIPGKSAVGIEVPNPERTMITLRELLNSSEFETAKSKVTFAVGKDIGGQTIVTDIAKMPHLLIAGATGSGKSVLINTIIMSIIYKADPNDVKMIMVDPKMVELTAYEDIPHLMIPVVKDPKKASAALAWAVAEMTTRYKKFADAGVREINSYNKKIGRVSDKNDAEFQKMPQIVIIVDEFADLMMVAPGEVEDAVCRLAQLARAAGIHLVLATQRPSVNVITGLIKANIPSRIALSVSSAVDSRTIIDSGGAEKLLGNGDMLFAPQNLPKPIRVQGAFVSDEERDRVVDFLKSNSGPSYNDEVTAHIDSAPEPGSKNAEAAVSSGPEQDELFADAGFFIIEKDKASIGLLQRMFRIGFNRAARIMDQLADAGVVGPEEGTKARQILMTREQFEEHLEGAE